MKPLSSVAVPTQGLESLGPPFAAQAAIEGWAHRILPTAAVYMVNGQELRHGLAAAGTHRPISSEHVLPQPDKGGPIRASHSGHMLRAEALFGRAPALKTPPFRLELLAALPVVCLHPFLAFVTRSLAFCRSSATGTASFGPHATVEIPSPPPILFSVEAAIDTALSGARAVPTRLGHLCSHIISLSESTVLVKHIAAYGMQAMGKGK